MKIIIITIWICAGFVDYRNRGYGGMIIALVATFLLGVGYFLLHAS